MKMKWFLLLFPAAISFAQSANKCADLARFQMPGANIEISRAEMVAAGPARGGRGPAGPTLPAHCRVDGIVDKARWIGREDLRHSLCGRVTAGELEQRLSPAGRRRPERHRGRADWESGYRR